MRYYNIRNYFNLDNLVCSEEPGGCFKIGPSEMDKNFFILRMVSIHPGV